MAKKLKSIKIDAYQNFELSVKTANYSADGVKLLTIDEVRLLIGVEAKSLTITFVTNMQQKLVAEMKLQELQSAANWIISRIITQFPTAEAKVKRNRKIEIWLDGLPEEIE